MEVVGTTEEAGERLLAAWAQSMMPTGENRAAFYRSPVPEAVAADFAARLRLPESQQSSETSLPSPKNLLSDSARRLQRFLTSISH